MKGDSGDAPGALIYALGFIGAAIYFISQDTNFWMGVLGFLKATGVRKPGRRSAGRHTFMKMR